MSEDTLIHAPWTPLISIVIPTYNRVSLLRRAIDSVLAQSWPHLEVIVIDDGSTDETGPLLTSYGDRLRWEWQANQGQPAALNRGWASSRGEILSYLNSDDWLDPHAAARAVEAFAARPDAVLVYGDYMLIDEATRPFRRVQAPPPEYRYIVTAIHSPGPGPFFRRAAFERTGGWDPTLRFMPDFDFWVRLGLQGAFVHLPEVLAGYCVHPATITNSVPDRRQSLEPLRIMERVWAIPEMPAHMQPYRGQAFSMAHVLAARWLLLQGELREAARHLRTALTLWPRLVFNSRAIRMLGGGVMSPIRCRIEKELARMRRRVSA